MSRYCFLNRMESYSNDLERVRSAITGEFSAFFEIVNENDVTREAIRAALEDFIAATPEGEDLDGMFGDGMYEIIGNMGDQLAPQELTQELWEYVKDIVNRFGGELDLFGMERYESMCDFGRILMKAELTVEERNTAIEVAMRLFEHQSNRPGSSPEDVLSAILREGYMSFEVILDCTAKHIKDNGAEGLRKIMQETE